MSTRRTRAKRPERAEMTMPLTGVRHVDIKTFETVANGLQTEMDRLAKVRQGVLKKLSQLRLKTAEPKAVERPARHFSDLSRQNIALAASLKGIDPASPEYGEKKAQLEALKSSESNRQKTS